MAENNHQRTLALRAPRGVVFDRDLQGAGREPPLLQHLDRPRAHQGPEPHHPAAGAGARRSTKRGVRADRRSPPPRAVLPADHDRAGRDAGAGRRGHGAAPRLRAARRRRRAGADAAVSRRRWRRTCSATSARSTTRRSPTSDGLKSGDIVGQAGIEKVYNALLMGEDGAKRVVVNSVGREIRTLEEDPADRGQAAPADHRLRRAEGDRGRLQRRRASTARRWCSIRQRRRARRSPAVPAYDPNAFAAGIDRATWASLNTDELRPLQRPRDPGALLAGFDVQDGGGAGRRSRKASSRRTSRSTAPATRTSTAATSSAGRRAATARSTCATPSSSRATSTSTPSATCSASTRSTSGRRCSGSA